MSEILNSWKTLIEVRKQTHAWNTDKEVSKEIIENILAELHRRSASKQNRVLYKLSVLDYSDPEFRNTFYEFCIDINNPEWAFNPQVLAPYLFVFSLRNPGEDSYDFSNHGYDEYTRDLSCIEIGIASDFIIHSVAARGMNSGFCRCFYRDHDKAPLIADKLGLDTIEDIILAIGIGYSSNKFETLNPYTGKMVDAPRDIKWLSEPKPKKDDYIDFI